jgi:hypothetical protein
MMMSVFHSGAVNIVTGIIDGRDGIRQEKVDFRRVEK